MKQELNLSGNTKRKNAVRILGTALLTLLLTGASCAVKHHYPVWPVPAKPKVVFFPCRAEPSPENKSTHASGPVYCIFGSDLFLINAYVEELLLALESYEREIRIINH